MDQPRPKIGTAIVILKDNCILLGKRKSNHALGTWGTPGGHLELGEEVEESVLREIDEEAGIKVKNLRRGPYTNDIFGESGKHYVTLWFIADYESGEPTVKEPDKFELWQWFKWGTLPQPLMLPIENLLKQNFNPLI